MTNLTELRNKKTKKGRRKIHALIFMWLLVLLFFTNVFLRKKSTILVVCLSICLSLVLSRKYVQKKFFSIFLSFFEVAIKLKNLKDHTETFQQFQVILRNFGIFKLIIKAMTTKKNVLCRIVDLSIEFTIIFVSVTLWYIKFEMSWNQNSSIKKCVGGVTKKKSGWERHLKELKELIIVTVVYLKQKHYIIFISQPF